MPSRLLAGTEVNQKDNDVFGNTSQWVNQLWRDLYGREGHSDSQATELANLLNQGQRRQSRGVESGAGQ